jgi:hypothetical protein
VWRCVCPRVTGAAPELRRVPVRRRVQYRGRLRRKQCRWMERVGPHHSDQWFKTSKQSLAVLTDESVNPATPADVSAIAQGGRWCADHVRYRSGWELDSVSPCVRSAQVHSQCAGVRKESLHLHGHDTRLDRLHQKPIAPVISASCSSIQPAPFRLRPHMDRATPGTPRHEVRRSVCGGEWLCPTSVQSSRRE